MKTFSNIVAYTFVLLIAAFVTGLLMSAVKIVWGFVFSEGC